MSVEQTQYAWAGICNDVCPAAETNAVSGKREANQYAYIRKKNLKKDKAFLPTPSQCFMPTQFPHMAIE